MHGTGGSLNCRVRCTANASFLHFGGVDYRTWVYVNGQLAGTHVGGNAAFSFEITRLLRDGKTNWLSASWMLFAVAFRLAASKRYIKSEGCDYTRTTGIWQPVWLEAVGSSFVESFSLIPDPDHARVLIEAAINGPDPDLKLVAEAFADGKLVGSDLPAATGGISGWCSIFARKSCGRRAPRFSTT